jgi:hypothetical protein
MSDDENGTSGPAQPSAAKPEPPAAAGEKDDGGKNSGEQQDSNKKDGDPKDGAAESTSPPTWDDTVRKLRGEAANLRSVRSGQIINQVLDRMAGLATVNVFQGEFSVEGDFVAGSGAGSAAGHKRTSRRATKHSLDGAELAEQAELYVRPAGFETSVRQLAAQRLLIFSGPARTGRRSRALQTLRKRMCDDGMPMPPRIFELTGNVLGNLTWRVPDEGCGFIVVERSHGKPAAAAVDDKWLSYATDQLREKNSYLVVTTGPVQGSLAQATDRDDVVVEDMELPDPVEIVRKRVRAECPWVSDEQLDGLFTDTELGDVLYDRDDPSFAVRAAKKVVDGMRGSLDLAEVVAGLRNAEQEVREWLTDDPDASEIAWVIAAAALEGSSYLNVADAAVQLYREIANSSGAMTPRYLRRLTEERSWIESVRPADEPHGPPVVRFRHADLRAAVLTLAWFELDGAREKIFTWLTKLARHTDVEVRIRAAGAAGVLATSDFEHGLHKYFLEWGLSESMVLRQSAAYGMNVAGRIGGLSDTVWREIEKWAELAHRDDAVSRLSTTSALAAGGPLGSADPRRALRLLRTLVCDAKRDVFDLAAVSTYMLLEDGRVEEVLDALLDWSESDSPGDRESVTKALVMFAFAAYESGSADTGASMPMLLRSLERYPERIAELWGRALAQRDARPLALDALRLWVSAADDDSSIRDAVLDVIARVADLGHDHYRRLLHELRIWAEDEDDPSETAADFYEELAEAGEMSA